MREMELYIHIPFCVRKCYYCDFLSAPTDEATRMNYVRRLIKEAETLAPKYADREVTTIFVGGGTPSILDMDQMERIMDAVHRNFSVRDDAEITWECNPGTLTPAKARAMKRAGVNRLSIGLQSIHRGELMLLGRIHSFEDFLMSYDVARKAGFSNINVDLISALPGQSVKEWKETLKKTVMMKPEHISAYSLIIEEGTPFFHRYHDDEARREAGEEPMLLPTEEEEREMYWLTHDLLTEHGYQQYEISNYARSGHACRHNIGYWTGKDYLGLGLGASSLIDNIRFKNTPVFDDYMTKPFERTEPEERTRKTEMEEFFFLGLRMTEGVTRNDFRDRFDAEPESLYGDALVQLKEQGLLEMSEGRIYLTARGVDVSNYVFQQLML
ncbi:MAG: radical SAM family heme chaperone HemW [Clostridiales bacterium]|nr:radical SAM family heme chaperone HemW [Clostridiales bacterium]